MVTQAQKDKITASLQKLVPQGFESRQLVDELIAAFEAGDDVESVLSTKGDIASFDTAVASISVGANGQFLVADSALDAGLGYKNLVDLVGGSEVKVVAADVTINNNDTLADIAGLETSSLAAGRKYLVELVLVGTGVSTTPDLDIKFVGSANSTLSWALGAPTDLTAAVNTIATEQTIAMDNLTSVVKAVGVLDIVDTAGTLKLQAAQNVATAEDTVIKAGTLLKITRIE